MKFYKMHGIGNDYIYFDCFEKQLENPEKLSVRLSDRRKSVGGDGIILVCKSDVADGKMRIFNADGSEGKMCGNGIRCVGKFLYEVKHIKKEILTVETLSGVKTLRLKVVNDKVEEVTADMGKEILIPDEIPAMFEGESVINAPLIVDGKTYFVTCVSIGNPHCVVFCDNVDELDLPKVGAPFERHAAFPEGVNTEFAQITGDNEVKMRVWERGSGETYACGTGACAVAVSAILNGKCADHRPVTVHLKGGDLTILHTDQTVYMTGGAEFSFTGEVEI